MDFQNKRSISCNKNDERSPKFTDCLSTFLLDFYSPGYHRSRKRFGLVAVGNVFLQDERSAGRVIAINHHIII